MRESYWFRAETLYVLTMLERKTQWVVARVQKKQGAWVAIHTHVLWQITKEREEGHAYVLLPSMVKGRRTL